MKKKEFTLIELLAVIVILAIIAVIATSETCFVVEDTSIVVSYEIGDNCENYFVNNNDW